MVFTKKKKKMFSNDIVSYHRIQVFIFVPDMDMCGLAPLQGRSCWSSYQECCQQKAFGRRPLQAENCLGKVTSPWKGPHPMTELGRSRQGRYSGPVGDNSNGPIPLDFCPPCFCFLLSTGRSEEHLESNSVSDSASQKNQTATLFNIPSTTCLHVLYFYFTLLQTYQTSTFILIFKLSILS